MEIGQILSEIDDQIVKLQQARNLLDESSSPTASKQRKASMKAYATTMSPAPPRRRELSDTDRKRIAELIKKRKANLRKQKAKSKTVR